MAARGGDSGSLHKGSDAIARDGAGHQEDVAELVGALVAIDSQNPHLAPGAAGESELARYCVAWLKQRGVEAWLDEVEPGRHNAVGRVDGRESGGRVNGVDGGGRVGDGSGPVLSLCAHMDTVSVAGMDAPFEPRVEDGRLYGRGAYDMKGSVAAILLAMARLAANPPLRGTVLASLVIDEEYASTGAADFVKRYPSDGCIVTEPSEGQLILAHKGFVWASIETRGVAAHGSRWQDGISAVAAMGRIIAALDKYDQKVLRERTHPLLGPASMHCATISGGENWSTYAAHCTLRVERRTLPGETPDSVLQEIRDIVRATGEEASVELVLTQPPLECAPDSAIAQAVRDAATEATGAVPDDAGVAYWMDAAVFAAAGVETVNYGPAGAGAHAAVEWVDLASVASCAEVLEAAARRYCG
ncbi:MAG TPA: M20/M25/M40 family metallo-hydrolase [Longimicrobiales bacterium]|nr:M20/M25/M40 family metallo-hydrolase [Longimicrobiales bacterium]